MPLDVLKQLRKVDDNIIHQLNSQLSNTPSSEKAQHCSQLFDQLRQAYAKREQLIEGCLKYMDDEIHSLQEKLELSDSRSEETLRESIYSEQGKVCNTFC